MFENDNDFQEENLRRKKDKKISKHFDIFIEDEKFKIVNYFIKFENRGERKGEYLQLISKFNIIISKKEDVKILISGNKTEIEIIGDWAFTSWNVGNYNVGYWIKEFKKV
ncbi:hypothetical protein [Flavobacterium sp. CAN_S2]|uniref:hypothetical protein n=1 Tax=Flavobacterium sp. CAN_S2 TaxID=2787726 RepID=UPI0018CB7BE3